MRYKLPPIGSKIRLLCVATIKVIAPDSDIEFWYGRYTDGSEKDIVEVTMAAYDSRAGVITDEKGNKYPLRPEDQAEHLWVIVIGKDNS